MTGIRKHDFNLKEVTALVDDASNRNYLWVAFEKNASNICEVKKISATDFTQVFYTVEVPVDRINDMIIVDDDLFLAVEESSPVVGYRIGTLHPLSDMEAISITPADFATPVSLTYIGTTLYFLTPGASGEDAKVLIFETDGTYQEDVVLTDISDAQNITKDTNDNLWIITSGYPSTLVRVYDSGGYTFQSWDQFII